MKTKLLSLTLGLLILGQNSLESIYSKQSKLSIQVSNKTAVAPLLRSVLPELKRRTNLPILLPTTLFISQQAETGLFVQIDESSPSSYDLEVSTAPNCRGTTSCYTGEFFAKKGAQPYREDDTQQVRLAGGITGYLTPRHHKVEPKIQWVYRGVLYQISLDEMIDNPTDKRIKQWLVRIANSAIQAGPR